MHGVDTETKAIIESVIAAIEEGAFEEAIATLNAEIAHHNENKLIDFLLCSLLFWQKRMNNVKRIAHLIERAHYLLGEWGKYKSFCDKYRDVAHDLDQYIFVFRKMNNKIALAFLGNALNDPLVDEAKVHLYTARCHKGSGDYERAIATYRLVIGRMPQSSSAYAELGDCYLLIGNELIGRLFLREAFYINADEVDVTFLESELIMNIINRLRASKAMQNKSYKKWIGVYAVLWDIFTVKRELKTAEYGVLRQRIYALEREYSETKSSALEPKLLYAYFYLLDYCRKAKNMHINSDEIMMKIKGINPNIYNMYNEKKGI